MSVLLPTRTTTKNSIPIINEGLHPMFINTCSYTCLDLNISTNSSFLECLLPSILPFGQCSLPLALLMSVSSLLFELPLRELCLNQKKPIEDDSETSTSTKDKTSNGKHSDHVCSFVCFDVGTNLF